jgi:hypothetical protein
LTTYQIKEGGPRGCWALGGRWTVLKADLSRGAETQAATVYRLLEKVVHVIRPLSSVKCTSRVVLQPSALGVVIESRAVGIEAGVRRTDAGSCDVAENTLHFQEVAGRPHVAHDLHRRDLSTGIEPEGMTVGQVVAVSVTGVVEVVPDAHVVFVAGILEDVDRHVPIERPDGLRANPLVDARSVG